MRECGGCKGLGAHIRWCPKVVGPYAAEWGNKAQQVNNAADSVGSNNPGLANNLYHAAAVLREMAEEQADLWRRRA